MRVKMTTGLSGPKYCLTAGDEHEFAEYEALRLIEAGFAERIESEQERELRLEAERKAVTVALAAKAAEDESAKAAEEAATKAAQDAAAEAGAMTAPAATDAPSSPNPTPAGARKARASTAAKPAKAKV